MKSFPQVLHINPLGANHCLSVFDYFVVLALKEVSFLHSILNGLNGLIINSLS